MKNNEVIVVGAGAAGLVTARQLSRADMKVTVVEARDHIGGRTHTVQEPEFEFPVELGAEFIHGKLPITIGLLKEYQIPYSPAKGQIWHVQKGKPEKDKNFISEHHDLLKKKLKGLRKDTTIKKFLDKNFPEKKFMLLRRQALAFVGGYESAEPEKFSALAFRKDWPESEEWDQYRVDGGYQALINALADECRRLGCIFHHSSLVSKIKWKKNRVEAVCGNGKLLTANRAVITVPLGVWQSGSILYSPALKARSRLVKKLGFGHVIKILLLFRSKFWEEKGLQQRLGENLDKLAFLFSETPVPAWWTQYPSPVPLLTGWISGPLAKDKMHKSDTGILEEALQSLASIFELKEPELKQRLKAWKIINWSKDPFTRGSYAYATVGADKLIEKLGKPEKNTLFFAGELFSEGGGMVEDALASGFKAAEQILVAGK